MHIKYPITHCYALSPEVVGRSLHVDVQKGLTEQEAQERRGRFGSNIYEQSRPVGLIVIFFRQFKSAVVYLLFAGAVISLWFKDLPEAISILAVILINALIGFFLEWKARTSMNELRKLEIITAKILRDGYMTVTNAADIVPGDILFVEAGDVVPADGRLFEAQQLQCDESALTGESQPVLKKIQSLAGDTITAEQQNMIFKGTSVTNGNGRAIVTGTAKNTELGKITALVEQAPDETDASFNRKLNRLTQKLVWSTLLITAVFIVVQSFRGKSLFLILETAVALSVASIPEGLPVVATIAISAGMLAMARRNAIVKKPAAIEALGGTSVILTDKTGTLTENKIEINTLTFPEEKFTFSADATMPVLKKSTLNLEKLVLAGVLCNNADNRVQAGADPAELSLLRMARLTGFDPDAMRTAYPRISEIPFSSETMMMITLHQGAKGYLTAAKGAAEQLLKICDRLLSANTIRQLTQADRDHLLRQADDMAGQGLRVLAFAWKEDMPRAHDGFSQGLIFAGLAGFLDPPRIDIKGALKVCRQAGIRVVMITGDHPRTALNIAHQVGLARDDGTQIINGKTLPADAGLTPEWRNKILHATVFARTTPQQKLEIARVYKEAGNIVAMTGDGINDAPALKEADIGIAMGLRGTQVARETADIVLKDDSFISITEAIAQGRAIFRNIQKFVIYLVSCNLAEVLTVTLLGIFLPAATLLPLQILFLNIVTDIFPALALGLGKTGEGIMLQPSRPPGQEILNKTDWLKVTGYAATMSITTGLTVVFCKNAGMAASALNNVAFFTLIFMQLAHVFNMADFRSGFFSNEVTGNKFVWWAILLCLVIVAAAYAIPQLQTVLALQAVQWSFLFIYAAAGLAPLLFIQLTKYAVIKISKR